MIINISSLSDQTHFQINQVWIVCLIRIKKRKIKQTRTTAFLRVAIGFDATDCSAIDSFAADWSDQLPQRFHTCCKSLTFVFSFRHHFTSVNSFLTKNKTKVTVRPKSQSTSAGEPSALTFVIALRFGWALLLLSDSQHITKRSPQ